MTKADLVNYVAEETGLTKVDSAKAVDAVFEGIIEGLKEKRKVTVTGYCIFTATDKKEKEGRNPRTGEPVTIPARVAVSIKAGSKLKDALN